MRREDTYSVRVEAMDRMAQASKAQAIADYRRRHPEATGTDKAVWALYQMEVYVGRVQVVEAPW